MLTRDSRKHVLRQPHGHLPGDSAIRVEEEVATSAREMRPVLSLTAGVLSVRSRRLPGADCGRTWEEQGDGLPDRGFFAGVMRDAMCVDDADPAGVYFGSRDGSVYASPDEGESWVTVAEHLPDVLCVRAATV